MNKELLDKVVCLHTEIDNVGKKIEAIKSAKTVLLLDSNDEHININIDISEDAISFIRERYEANLAGLQAELDKYDIVDSVPLTGVNPSDNPGLDWVNWVAKDYDKRIWAYSEKPRKSKNVWRSDDRAPKQISTEQAVSLCGCVPEWSDGEPTPVVNR